MAPSFFSAHALIELATKMKVRHSILHAMNAADARLVSKAPKTCDHFRDAAYSRNKT